MLTVLAAIAQLESKTIREWQEGGIAVAKWNGTGERTPKLTLDVVERAANR